MSRNFFGIRIRKNSGETITFAIDVNVSVHELLYSLFEISNCKFNKTGNSANFFDKFSMHYHFIRTVQYIDVTGSEKFEYLDDKRKVAIKRIIEGDLGVFKPPTIRNNRVYINHYGNIYMPYKKDIFEHCLGEGLILDVDKISLEVYNNKYNDDLYSMYNIPKVCSINIKSFTFFVNTVGKTSLVSNDFLFNRMREQELKLQSMRENK